MYCKLLSVFLSNMLRNFPWHAPVTYKTTVPPRDEPRKCYPAIIHVLTGRMILDLFMIRSAVIVLASSGHFSWEMHM